MIEKFLRLVFKAPTVHVRFDEDETLPANWVAVDSKTLGILGMEPLDEGMIGSEVVVVAEDDTPVAAVNIIGMFGHGPLPLRRRVLSRLLRHLIGAAWTLAGMVIVVLTLSGAVQIISLIVCLLFFMIDLMTISLRRP
jgi:hypothetical protein